MNPEIDDVNKKVIFVVGELELDASGQPTGEGASGPRIKIGEVEFSRKSADDPWLNPADPSQPVTFFGLDLSLDRDGDYVNFVNTYGDPLDGSATKGSITAAMRGGANADNQISASDFTTIRGLFFSAGYSVDGKQTKMKKMILAAVTLCFIFIAIPAISAPITTASGDYAVSPGDTFTIDIVIGGIVAEAITDFSFRLVIDPNSILLPASPLNFSRGVPCPLLQLLMVQTSQQMGRIR